MLAHTPTPMRMVRLTPPQTDRFIQSAMGPTSHTAIDGLYDPQGDWAIELEGEVICQPASDGVVILAGLPGGDSRSQTVLTLTSHPDFTQRPVALYQGAYVPGKLAHCKDKSSACFQVCSPHVAVHLPPRPRAVRCL